MVVTDGAAIYTQADFDSQVQDYLSYQTQVIVSKRPYAGAGGLGLFHRVRYQNKMGFITDTDLKLSKKEAEKAPSVAKAKKSKFNDGEDGDKRPPLYLTRFFGGAVSMVNFTEKYSGRKLSDRMMMYGMRMTGPGTLFDGPPLDFNFWFSLQKPKYLSNFTSGTPTGFLLFGDVLAMLPLVDAGNTLVSYGFGLMWVYTRYMIPVNGTSFDSQEFRIGGVMDLGVGHRFGKIMVRADAKYYYEKTAYLGYGLSVQGEY